jgi:hypothetical protein
VSLDTNIESPIYLQEDCNHTVDAQHEARPILVGWLQRQLHQVLCVRGEKDGWYHLLTIIHAISVLCLSHPLPGGTAGWVQYDGASLAPDTWFFSLIPPDGISSAALQAYDADLARGAIDTGCVWHSMGAILCKVPCPSVHNSCMTATMIWLPGIAQTLCSPNSQRTCSSSLSGCKSREEGSTHAYPDGQAH